MSRSTPPALLSVVGHPGAKHDASLLSHKALMQPCTSVLPDVKPNDNFDLCTIKNKKNINPTMYDNFQNVLTLQMMVVVIIGLLYSYTNSLITGTLNGLVHIRGVQVNRKRQCW